MIMNAFWTILVIFVVVFLVLLFACILVSANGHYPEDDET